MVLALFAVAAAMVVGGAWAIVTGWDMVVLERGWSLVISGATAATGGALLLGLALASHYLQRIARRLDDEAVRSAPGRAADTAYASRALDRGPLRPAQSGHAPPEAPRPAAAQPPAPPRATAPSSAAAPADLGPLGASAVASAMAEPQTEPAPQVQPPPQVEQRSRVEPPPAVKPQPLGAAPPVRGEIPAPRVEAPSTAPSDADGKPAREEEEKPPEAGRAAGVPGSRTPPVTRIAPTPEVKPAPTTTASHEKTPAPEAEPPPEEPAGAGKETAPPREAASHSEAASGETAREEPEPEAEEEMPVVGTYASGGNTYTMFADGSIRADTASGTHHFADLDELKDFIAAGGEDIPPERSPAAM